MASTDQGAEKVVLTEFIEIPEIDASTKVIEGAEKDASTKVIESAEKNASTKVIEGAGKDVVTKVIPSQWQYSYVDSVKEPNDELLFEKDFEVTWLFLRRVTIDVPYSGDKEITCILVTNKWIDGTGGYVRITSGGVGFKYVNICLQSQVMRGFHFGIQIWGRGHYISHLNVQFTVVK